MAPAIGVDDANNPREIQQEIIAKLKQNGRNPFGYVLFPGKAIIQDMSWSISSKELKRITRQVDFIAPTLVGAVSYRFVFGGESHQTGFAVEVRRSDAPRPEAKAKNRSPSAIFPDAGNVPADQLRLVSSILSGDYAD